MAGVGVVAVHYGVRLTGAADGCGLTGAADGFRLLVYKLEVIINKKNEIGCRGGENKNGVGCRGN